MGTTCLNLGSIYEIPYALIYWSKGQVVMIAPLNALLGERQFVA